MKTRPLRRKAIVTWLISAGSPKWFLLAAAVLVVGGAWLFFGVLEDVISHDPLVDADVFAYHLLQSLRTPVMDRVMIAVTELGDAQVLLPVILVALAWFLGWRLWLTAGYWLAAIGVAEVLAKVLKVALHRPRPGAFYGGIEQFSFPSGHATMSVVVYGFLAFLLCRNTGAGLRKAVIALTVMLVGLVMFSRLYLGAHWLSDVLGGSSFGVAWIAALAIAYEYQSHELLRPGKFAGLMLATVIIAGGVHIASGYDADRLRYAPQPTLAPTSRQNADAVGALHGGETVGNHQPGAAFFQTLQRLLGGPLRMTCRAPGRLRRAATAGQCQPSQRSAFTSSENAGDGCRRLG